MNSHNNNLLKNIISKVSLLSIFIALLPKSGRRIIYSLYRVGMPREIVFYFHKTSLGGI